MKGRVVECVKVGGKWCAYVECPAIWVGWEYEATLDGRVVKALGLVLRSTGPARVVVRLYPLDEPLEEGSEVSLKLTPLRRLYPA